MDIFQRAANLFDRAQGRMTDATSQAARIVLSAAQMRALEARQAELRRQIEQATMDLGKLTFQRWKNRGIGNDGALASLCASIDTLNAEYQRVLSDLADARAAVASPVSYPPHSAPPPFIGQAGSYSATSAPPPTAPYAAPPPPAMPPPADHYVTALLPPPSPRPVKLARECPECYTMVPGAADFCPSCGMRV